MITDNQYFWWCILIYVIAPPKIERIRGNDKIKSKFINTGVDPIITNEDIGYIMYDGH